MFWKNSLENLFSNEHILFHYMNLSEFNYFQIVNIYVILNLSVLQIILENILEYKYSESLYFCVWYF